MFYKDCFIKIACKTYLKLVNQNQNKLCTITFWEETEPATRGILWKKVFLEIRKTHRKIPVPETKKKILKIWNIRKKIRFICFYWYHKIVIVSKFFDNGMVTPITSRVAYCKQMICLRSSRLNSIDKIYCIINCKTITVIALWLGIVKKQPSLVSILGNNFFWNI